ncbi:TPA: helix-turn-helix domain-containing protein [Burkholderia vietnamiensis]|nr:helix-turn-helix domain-containing protein [Burkholderia vietnamiensis]
MSIHLMNQAWRTDLATGAKFVLVVICDAANEDGFCWPSVTTIAARCSMGERTVHGHLQDLEAAGIISRKIRRGQNTHYHVHLDKFPFQVEKPKKRTTAKPAVPQELHGRENCGSAEAAPPQNSAGTPAASGTEPPQNSTVTPADSATITTSKPKGKPQEPPNSARLASRVCVVLPDWLDPKAWERWEGHRLAIEAAGGAIWSQALADVSLLALAQRRTEGHDPAECINASILGNWSGIYPPRKVSPVGDAMAANVPDDWFKTESGIVERGKQLGIVQKANEQVGIELERFKARVFRAAGPGKWQDDMLNRVTRESEERGAALLAFFTGVPREGGAQQRAA